MPSKRNKKTVWAAVYFTNPFWGLRSERNRLEYKEVKMFARERDLLNYLERKGFEREAKTQYKASGTGAVEIRKRTV